MWAAALGGTMAPVPKAPVPKAPVPKAPVPKAPVPKSPVLFTVGHSTASREDLSELLRQAGVRRVVDVRTAPGSRRHPQFGRHELEVWMPEDGFTYRWEPALGGFRRPSALSPNVALRHPSFRGYADYMTTAPFAAALRSVLDEAGEEPTAVMCSEALWWRCHRRLIADAATLLFGVEVAPHNPGRPPGAPPPDRGGAPRPGAGRLGVRRAGAGRLTGVAVPGTRQCWWAGHHQVVRPPILSWRRRWPSLGHLPPATRSGIKSPV